MRQPAVSGPEKEIPRERAEYVPAKLPGAITGIRNSSRTFGLSPLGTFGPPPLPGLFADLAQTDLVSRTSPESPFQVAVRPKWTWTRSGDYGISRQRAYKASMDRAT
jgi:hypothetical protein